MSLNAAISRIWRDCRPSVPARLFKERENLNIGVSHKKRDTGGYKMRGRLLVPGTDSSIILPSASIGRLLADGETDAMALLALLRKSHTRGRPFAASPEAMERARVIGSWGKKRYRNATRKLCEVGELVQLHKGGRGEGDPSLYRFRSRGLI